MDQARIDRIRSKFVHECELMSRLRHPHIVQFLGVCFLPDSNSPALVTELLLTDLHTLLLGQRKPYIPLGLKFSILHDVAQGLFFLHSRSPPIIHRDLTAANVLLNPAMVAKIADLGVARLLPPTRVPLTKGPGNAAYMPPETQGDEYNESVDVFSFGVLTLFSLTQTFPEPLPTKYVVRGESLSRTEVQRRNDFLEQIRNEFKGQEQLVGVIEECLDDIPARRPKIQEVFELLALAKHEHFDNHIEMNKLELVQAIMREREELVEHFDMERVELVQHMDKEREEAIEQKDREYEEVMKQKDREHEEAMKQKDSEHEEAMKQRDREYREAIVEKDREHYEEIEKEKEEAVQQKERQIVDELMGILEVREDGETVREEVQTNVTGDSVEAPAATHEAESTQETTASEKQKKRGKAVLIIGSSTAPPQPSTGYLSSIFKPKLPEVVVPQSPADLSDDDRRVLTELGLPPDKWDNLNALLAVYNETKAYDMFSVQVSKPGMELSRSYVLEYLLINSANKEGAIIHYYGNGRRNTGDWCFRDGYITFRDIANLYITHSCCHSVTVVSDCCHSTEWGAECAKFLDEQGVRPCGYSAREKGILLNIYTACTSHKDAVGLCYVTKIMAGMSDCKATRDGEKQKPAEESRAVFILGSIAPHSNEAVVPQSPADLSDDDRHVLTELGLPPDKWDNLNALLAVYNRDKAYDVFSVQVSTPGMELSRSYILKQIEYLLINSANKEGAVLHYYGNGRRNTGDWCFRDGYITFRDIATLYMKHSCGRVLVLVPDCHSSGHWVGECAKFLDEQGVRPCGHSATEKGILLKVYAACKTGQDAAELCYTTRAMELRDDGFVYHWTGEELSDQQKTLRVNFTKMRCGKGKSEECSIASNSTWSTAREVTSGRIFIVRQTEKGRPAWYYILLDDDAEKIRDFIQGEKYYVDLTHYGTVLKSGWGKDPPQDMKDWIEKYGRP